MKNVEISVIMPIYNTSIEYLKKAIESVINQSFKNIELILILDGSNDNVSKLCSDYAKKDKRIKIYKQENEGEGASRNKGIELSIGKWICFVDSDDWLDKDILEKLYKKLEENKDIDILIFNCYINYLNTEFRNSFYNTKNTILNKEDVEEIKLQNIGKGITRYFPDKCNISVVWSKIYRKDFIIKNKLKFQTGIKRMPDTIFNIDAFEMANKIFYYNIFGYHYRKNSNSVTNNYDKNLKKDIDIFLEYVENYIKKYNKNQKFKDTYYIATLTKINQLIENYYVYDKEYKNQINNLLNNKNYQSVLKNVKSSNINLYQKLMLYNIKRKKLKTIINLVKIKLKVKALCKRTIKIL